MTSRKNSWYRTVVERAWATGVFLMRDGMRRGVMITALGNFVRLHEVVYGELPSRPRLAANSLRYRSPDFHHHLSRSVPSSGMNDQECTIKQDERLSEEDGEDVRPSDVITHSLCRHTGFDVIDLPLETYGSAVQKAENYDANSGDFDH